jgi:hypothetical protein
MRMTSVHRARAWRARLVGHPRPDWCIPGIAYDTGGRRPPFTGRRHRAARRSGATRAEGVPLCQEALMRPLRASSVGDETVALAECLVSLYDSRRWRAARRERA